MISRRLFLSAAAATPAVLILARPAMAEGRIFAQDGVAIRGADPVAYFTQMEPVIGSAEHALEWTGVTWHFASAENLETFMGDPQAYAPQYGGYCAWAVAEGYTATSVPEAWAVVDGKLYLNFSPRIQRRWARDIPGNIVRADANWPTLLN